MLGVEGRQIGWQIRPLAVRNPKEQFIPVRIAEYECRPPPLNPHRFETPLADVLKQRQGLIVFKTDEGPSASCSISSWGMDLVEDEFESEQAHLKDPRATVVLMIPVESEP